MEECDSVSGLFSDYYDGQLSEFTKHSLESHLSSCERCKKEWQRFQNTVSLMQHLPLVEPPADFLVSVNARIQKQSGWRGIVSRPARALRWVPMPLKASAAAAVIALIFVIGVVVGQGYPGPSEDPPLVASAVMPEDTASAAETPYRSSPVDVSWVTTGNPRPREYPLSIETPSEFITSILRHDPELKNHQIHSDLLGAVVLTPEKLYKVDVSTEGFIRIRNIIESGRGKMPASLREAVNLYPWIQVKVLPSPLAPLPASSQ